MSDYVKLTKKVRLKYMLPLEHCPFSSLWVQSCMFWMGVVMWEVSENPAVGYLMTSWLICPSLCAGLPLPSASVDAVVCDLPFGRKFGTKANMAANLPCIVTEMERFVPLFGSFSSSFSKCLVNPKGCSSQCAHVLSFTTLLYCYFWIIY